MLLQFRRFLLPILIMLVAACTTQDTLPTLVPTATVPSATNTPLPSPTPAPTFTPSPTPDIPQTTADNPGEQAFMRFVHAAPAYGAVDMYLNDLSVVRDFAFTQVSGQGGITAGTYQLRVLPADSDPAADVLFEQPVTITEATASVFVFTGTLETPALTMLPEDTTPMQAGESRITVYNAIPRGPAITLETSDAALTTPLDFGVISSPVIMPEGRDVLELQTGIESLQTFDFRFREYDSYLLIVTGQPDNLEDLTVLTLESRVFGLGDVRFIMTVNDFDGVDVYRDGELFLPDMGFGSDTDYMQTEARTYQFAVYPAGESPDIVEPIFVSDVMLRPATRQTILITGQTGEMRLINLEFDEELLQPGEARFTFVNPLTSAPRVLLETLDNGDFDLFSGQVSENNIVEAEPQNFIWYLKEGRDLAEEPLETATDVEVTEGINYIYILSGQGVTDTPLLYTDIAGIDTPPADPDNPNAIEEEDILAAPQVRLVNVVENQSVDYRIDDILIVSNLAPGSDNPLLTVQEGDHTITVNDSVSGELLARDILAFEPGTIHSLYVFEDGISYGLFSTADEWFNFENFPAVRLVNLSAVGTFMGVAHAPYVPPVNATSPPQVIEPDVPLDDNGQPIPIEVDDFGIPIPTQPPQPATRRSIPFGLDILIEDIPPLEVSLSDALASSAARNTIFILDSGENTIACEVPDVMLVPGQRYDIVAYENILTTVVGCAVVPYNNS